MMLGILGRPNTGKSTFFKAATLSEVLIANYPFATIKANHGMGYVKIDCIDKELNTQCEPREGFCINHNRFVPVELLDVAGLVPGASEGKGLGNQFLDDLREADAFILVLDLSGKTNEEGKPVDNYYPGNDIKFLEEELNLWFANIFKKVWKSFSRTLETEKGNFIQAVEKQFSGLKITEEMIKSVILKTGLNAEKPTSWKTEEIMKFASELRKHSKPMIIAANKCDTENAKENLKKIKKEFDYPIIPCSAESELALREATREEIIEYVSGEEQFKILKPEKLNEKQKQALDFIKKNVLDVYKSTGVQDILNYTVFDLLKYIAVFPAGSKLTDTDGHVLPDCYLMPPHSTALDFAFKLHTDLGKNFIKAINIHTKRAVGKNYELKHRDGIEIVAR